MRLINKGHRTCGLILNIFGQMRSTIYQMHVYFTKCVCIWPLLVSLTKCAAHLGKCAAQLAKCAHIWSNAACFINWSDTQRIWSIVQHIWPNAQTGQMQMCRLVKCALHSNSVNPHQWSVPLTVLILHRVVELLFCLTCVNEECWNVVLRDVSRRNKQMWYLVTYSADGYGTHSSTNWSNYADGDQHIITVPNWQRH